jgi:hypothetical protein
MAGQAGGRRADTWISDLIPPAARVAADVEFFDPNFGEFWFPNGRSFVSRMTGSLCCRSLYFAGLSGTFESDAVKP